MITVTKDEHDLMVESAQATLMVKMSTVNNKLKGGEEIEKSAVPIAVAFCNLLSLNNYETAKFDPDSYFNVQGPQDVSRSFSNVNTIDTGYNKK